MRERVLPNELPKPMSGLTLEGGPITSAKLRGIASLMMDLLVSPYKRNPDVVHVAGWHTIPIDDVISGYDAYKASRDITEDDEETSSPPSFDNWIMEGLEALQNDGWIIIQNTAIGHVMFTQKFFDAYKELILSVPDC